MELFRRNKREKPDIEFITKSKLKKLELVPEKNSGYRAHTNFIPNTTSTHRWLLQIPTEMGIEDYWCSFARPTQQSREMEIPYLSTSTWSYGGIRWDDLYLEIRDYDSSGRGLTEWFQSTMTTMTGRQGYGGSPKKTVTVEMLDPTGVAVEKWTLIGCMPKEVRFHQNFDDVDQVLGINFSIDRAILNT